jgi:glycosyltransferase involved in cell wall biosynthesis
MLNGIVTSTPGSCPVSGKKVYAIGQGVDPADFIPPAARPEFESFPLIHIGRFDPSKNIPEIIKVCKKFVENGTNLSLTQVGSPSTPQYRKLAEEVISANSSLPWLSFQSSVLQEVPVITVNREYLDIFGGWSDSKNPSLESELGAVVGITLEALAKELSRRREIALNSHSLGQWADSVVELLNSGKK